MHAMRHAIGLTELFATQTISLAWNQIWVDPSALIKSKTEAISAPSLPKKTVKGSFDFASTENAVMPRSEINHNLKEAEDPTPKSAELQTISAAIRVGTQLRSRRNTVFSPVSSRDFSGFSAFPPI